MGGRRGPELHPVEGAEGAEEIAAAPLEALGGPLVVARRAAHLRREHGLAAALESHRVLGVHLRAHVAQEAQVAVARLAAHRLELVAEHRREADRDRRAVEQVEQRQVDARHGLPEPLLAERPRAEALHVGHVGVKDERERPAALAHPGRRSTATKSSARSRPPGAKREVAGGDRGREAVVEGLRDPQRGVHAVPAGAQRQLVDAELARVEEAVHLEAVEHRRAQRPELLGAVLAQVPRVVRLVGAGRGQREQVRRGHVGGAARAQQRLEVAQHVLGALHVLDRLEEHHRVALLAVALHQVAHEADAGPRVLEPGVLVGLGVGVHPGHRAGAARQHVGAVALAAGHVHHVEARAAVARSTRTRPGGAGTSSSRPAHRASCARRSGRAAGRPRAGPAGRSLRSQTPEFMCVGPLVGGVGFPPAWRHATRSATPTSATTTSRPPATTPSGESRYDAEGERQVLGKLRKALGRRASALRAGARDRRRHRLLHPQPGPRRRGERGAWPPTSRPACSRCSRPSAAGLGVEVETAACEASALPFEDDSFDLVVGHAVLHHLPDLDAAFREFRRVLRPGGVVAFCGEPSHYGDRLAELPEAGRTRRRAAVAGADGRRTAPERAQRHGPRGGPARAGGGRARLHPGRRCRRTRAGPGSRSVRVSGEELAASLFGWANRALEATAAPDEIPYAWRMYAYRGYLLLQALDRSLLEPRLPAAMFYNLLISGRAPLTAQQGIAPARRDSLTTHPSTASRKGSGWCGTSRSEAASERAAAARRPSGPERVEHLGRLRHRRARAAACRASAVPRPAGPRSPPPRAARWPPARAGSRAAPAGAWCRGRGRRPGRRAARRRRAPRRRRARWAAPSCPAGETGQASARKTDTAISTAHSVLASSSTKATAAANDTARGSKRPRCAGAAGSGSSTAWSGASASSSSQARRPRGYTSTCTVVANAAQATSPIAVTTSASVGAHLEAQPPGERVVGAGIGVEPAGDHPDEERRGGRVVEQPDAPRRRRTARARPAPRACSRPRIGAVMAWVSGTPKRAGPMMATVSSIAAMLAPKPCRAPRRSATRAIATPPASATQKPPVGAARAARNETTATCAGPEGTREATVAIRRP